MISVRFTYLTGLKRQLFRNARLAGSWNSWAETPMDEITSADGCPAFTKVVDFDDARAGQKHRWGVRVRHDVAEWNCDTTRSPTVLPVVSYRDVRRW